MLSSRQIFGPMTLAAPLTMRKARCSSGHGWGRPHLYFLARGSVVTEFSGLVKSCWMRGKPLPGPPRRMLTTIQVRPTVTTRATMRRGPGGRTDRGKATLVASELPNDPGASQY